MKMLLTFGFLCGWLALAGAEDKKAEAKFDAEKLVGKWKFADGKKGGNAVGDDTKKSVFVITKDRISINGEDGKEMYAMEYTVDAKASPVTIDMKMVVPAGQDAKAKGIIELDGDSFKICYDPSGEKRPEKFDGDKFYNFSFKREKAEKK
ncbi:hypothetical protein BH11PLA2_BH11PLA2_26580 [soil metagenome]